MWDVGVGGDGRGYLEWALQGRATKKKREFGGGLIEVLGLLLCLILTMQEMKNLAENIQIFLFTVFNT